ncbi:amidase [Mesorhizobium sp. M0701]|uniref:amidase n=1 Tax=Mesorhizobium sp. M0701 TaxID=2956989 RepID=UPI00333B68B2
MRLNEYAKYDATGLASLVRAGEVTPVELTRLARQAHDEVNPLINAVIEFYEDAETVAGEDAGPFNGVPFLRKDSGASEAGRLQENGSRLYKGHRSDTDSFFFRRARDAGLRTIGRTALPEFGQGLSESILNGITSNPWNLERSAGGSSAGAAAAVAAGIVPIAHGSDGGGSIRFPASWCGLIGLNPSRGRISGGPNNQDRWLGLSRTFVLCRTVRDMAVALDVFSGPHPGDPFIIVQPNRPYVEELSQPSGTLRVGVARKTWGTLDPTPEVLHAVESVASLLEEMGHVLIDIAPPFEAEELTKIMLGVSDLGASSLEIAARALGRTISADTLEPVNLKLYERGQGQSLSASEDLNEMIRRVRLRVGEAIDSYDILLTPTAPIVALQNRGNYWTESKYSLGNPTISAEQYMQAGYELGEYTGVFNITGQPAVSLPLAQTVDGLPIGIQIAGRFGDETTLVRIARDLEEAIPWAKRRPRVFAGSAE